MSPTFSDIFAISGFCTSCARGGATGVAASSTSRANVRFIRTFLVDEIRDLIVEYTLSSSYTAVNLKIFPRSEFEEFRGEEGGKELRALRGTLSTKNSYVWTVP